MVLCDCRIASLRPRENTGGLDVRDAKYDRHGQLTKGKTVGSFRDDSQDVCRGVSFECYGVAERTHRAPPRFSTQSSHASSASAPVHEREKMLTG